MSGILYVVGTPIGNLSDFSPRAIDTLASVDFIAAEDTRVTLKLLNHFDIKKEMVSYFEHNKRQRGEIICQRILAGESCAIVTDAGMPAISDPGEDLVALCHELGIVVQSVRDPLPLQQHWQYRVCLREGLLLKASCRLIKNQDVNILKKLRTKNVL